MARLVASITVIAPGAGVSYVYPVASISYILMAATAETDASGRHRFVLDAVVMADGRAISFSKQFQDQVVEVDKKYLAVAKPVVDVVTLPDTLKISLTFFRNFQDSFGNLDARAWAIAKPLAEGYLLADSKALSLNKNLADAFALNDGSVIGDGIAFVAATRISNVVVTSDFEVYSLTKQLTDAISAVDSGVVSMQGYCDLSYFSTDYVGISRQF